MIDVKESTTNVGRISGSSVDQILDLRHRYWVLLGDESGLSCRFCFFYAGLV